MLVQRPLYRNRPLRSPGVNWLSFARRDAAALHGPFTDLMGGETVLLTGELASRAAIEEEFRRLEARGTRLVVVAFSGHGSETHELVAYDTDPYDISGPIDPAHNPWRMVRTHPTPPAANRARLSFFRRMGAKGLQVGARARPLKSVDAELNRISGEGRAVLTAAGPTQPAWESSRFSHGFLTFYLI